MRRFDVSRPAEISRAAQSTAGVTAASASGLSKLRWLLAAAVVAGVAIAAAAFLTFGSAEGPRERPPANPLDASRAFGYLVEICRLGPRPSGSEGMEKQQEVLVAHFEKHGAQVRLQEFDAAHPLNGQPVRMRNLIASWHPEAERRVLLCCHYDTRPWPDLDPVNPRGTFVGANDGGSGVALFMELAHHLPKLKLPFGVDFVLFDGEELVYGDRGEYFLGSKHFANEYALDPPKHRYVCGVLVDMVGDKQLNLYKEANSLKYAPDVTNSVWRTARRLDVDEFIGRRRHEIQDDHLPLNQIARIPTCDVIDFDYGPQYSPHWHTTRDVPENCSGESLAKVGYVLLEWLAEDVPVGKSE
ncbi:MAG: M28 family peptidase [Planctomycetes bacterium]|nr:M28 family peptidase [Planctomycetota bacterium]